MLNSEAKQAAIKRLESACQRHDATLRATGEKATALHELRTSTAQQVVAEAERYYSALANAPKEFGKVVGDYRVAFERFNHVVEQVRSEAEAVATVGGSMAGAGTLAGVGMAAFGPTAAMAIATTFGTASTGTAIATLSGAAATNAALAWLGMGTIAAGGGGMAGGSALLAAAGPIGWGIGLVALGGAAWYAADKNEAIAKEATSKAQDVEGRVVALQAANTEIDGLRGLTKKHAAATVKEIARLRREAPNDYRQFSGEQKEAIAALKNNIEALSSLLLAKAMV